MPPPRDPETHPLSSGPLTRKTSNVGVTVKWVFSLHSSNLFSVSFIIEMVPNNIACL